MAVAGHLSLAELCCGRERAGTWGHHGDSTTLSPEHKEQPPQSIPWSPGSGDSPAQPLCHSRGTHKDLLHLPVPGQDSGPCCKDRGLLWCRGLMPGAELGHRVALPGQHSPPAAREDLCCVAGFRVIFLPPLLLPPFLPSFHPSLSSPLSSPFLLPGRDMARPDPEPSEGFPVAGTLGKHPKSPKPQPQGGKRASPVSLHAGLASQLLLLPRGLIQPCCSSSCSLAFAAVPSTRTQPLKIAACSRRGCSAIRAVLAPRTPRSPPQTPGAKPLPALAPHPGVQPHSVRGYRSWE